MNQRLAELRENAEALAERIEAACRAADRSHADVSVIAVTKTYPDADIRLLHSLGFREFGESREQEAAPKANALADLDLRWHFIGQLQSNKAARVARFADIVHSVDRAKLLPGLAAGAQERDHRLKVLLQVSLDGQTHRGGVLSSDLLELAAAVRSSQWLELSGLMAVAPLDEEPAAAFARLADLRAGFLREHPDATWLSAGMSEDLEAAVMYGATHLRIGSALLGNRPPLR